jgi:hypothetical protein
MWSILSVRTCSSRDERMDLDNGRWKSGKDRIGPPGSSRKCFDIAGSTLVAREMAFDVLLAEYVPKSKQICDSTRRAQ